MRRRAKGFMRADSVTEEFGDCRLPRDYRRARRALSKATSRAPRRRDPSVVAAAFFAGLFLAGLLLAENLLVFDPGPDQQAVAAWAHGPALAHLRLEGCAAPVADFSVVPF